MFKLFPLALFFFLTLSSPAQASNQDFCVSCGKPGVFRCTFESKTNFGLKPGRFFCKTYLSEAVNGSCTPSRYSFFQCGLKPRVIIKAGEYSKQELKVLKLTHPRSLFYLSTKGMVNLLEMAISGGEQAGKALSPALSKAGGVLDAPINQAKRASQNLIKKGGKAIDQASESVQNAKDSAQKKLEKAQKNASKELKKVRDSAQDQIDTVKDKANKFR